MDAEGGERRRARGAGAEGRDFELVDVVKPMLWLLGGYLRVKGIVSDEYRESVSARVEVVTPITSFSRIREGAFLWTYGASPYAGDALHQPPLVLALLSPLAGTPPPVWPLAIVFVLLQLLTAGNIYCIGRLYSASAEAREENCVHGLAAGDEEEERADFARAAREPALVDAALKHGRTVRILGCGAPAFAALVFWLNPASVLTCIGLSTLALDHFFITGTFTYCDSVCVHASRTYTHTHTHTHTHTQLQFRRACAGRRG